MTARNTLYRLITRYKTSLIALGLFLLALVIRLPNLDAFFTPDEFLWVDRSRNFLGGVLSPNFTCLLPDQDKTDARPGRGLACTLRTGHPGVVTMWSGAVGIWWQWLTRPAADSRTLLEFAQALPANPVDRATISPVRLPSVIILSLFVGLFYLLVRRLFKPEIALLAGLLLALNPFHIALSRVLHHDALSTSFIIASALSLMIYFGPERRRRWLVLAGVMAGLAMLSKSTGFFLIPYAGLLALWSLLANWQRGQTPFGRALRRAMVDGLLWAGLAGLTFFLIWPAMWVIPLKALNTIFVIGFKYASGGHAKGVFFLGDISKDPGPLFYPVTWLFRATFWSMLGVVVAAGLAVGALRGRPRGAGWFDKLSPRGFNDKTGLLLWVGAFLFFFLLVMTWGEKKQDRYILPVYPLLDLVAAVGLLGLIRRPILQGARRTTHDARRATLLIAGILLVSFLTLLPYAPYYFTYYNPLLGGIKMAARLMTIGWGEGLNLAAGYLNTKPEAEGLQVASWYGSTFAPFFKGETIRYSDQKGNALGGDYVVFYINQRQREFPDPEIWRYFSENFSLEQTILLDGVEYAWIFTGPGIAHYVEDQRYSGIAALLGWDWSGAVNPDRNGPAAKSSQGGTAPLGEGGQGPVRAGSDLSYALFWEYLGKTPEEDFFFRLIGPDGRIWAESTSRPTAQFADSSAWREGQIIEEQGALHIPFDTPPGLYTLQIGFYTKAPAVTGGELTFPTPNQPLAEPLQVLEVASPGPAEATTGTPLLELQLLSPAPLALNETGKTITFDLTWVAPQTTAHVYQAAFALLDWNVPKGGETGVARWAWEPRPLIEFLPTPAWPAAAPLRSRWTLPLAERAPGGSYRLQLRLLDETGQTAHHDLGAVQIPGRARDFSPPQPAQAVEATFDQAVALPGFDLSPAELQPGQPLAVTLYWQSLAPLDQDYTVFLQLLGPAGEVYAQQDKAPLAGAAPTSTWTPGEIIADTYTLSLPENLPPGDYKLITGFYLFETGGRLAVHQAGAESDYVLLQGWTY